MPIRRRWIHALLLLAWTSLLAAQESRPIAPPQAIGLAGRTAIDLDGTVRTLGGDDRDRPIVLIFLDTECPISRAYTPRLSELGSAAEKLGVDFFGVFSEPATTRAAAVGFAREFKLTFPALFDASGEIASLARPTHFPEAFVYGADGRLIYRGRIDDLFADLGKRRAKATTNELEAAITAAAGNLRPAVLSAPPVGCVFGAWQDGAPPEDPEWTRDVFPILRMHCGTCHADGGVAADRLLTHEGFLAAAPAVELLLADDAAAHVKPRRGKGEPPPRFYVTPREKSILLGHLAANRSPGAKEDDPGPFTLEKDAIIARPDRQFTAVPSAIDTVNGVVRFRIPSASAEEFTAGIAEARLSHGRPKAIDVTPVRPIGGQETGAAESYAAIALETPRVFSPEKPWIWPAGADLEIAVHWRGERPETLRLRLAFRCMPRKRS